MNGEDAYFYSDAERYDLVEGAYARGPFLDFYRKQIARYGQPVLELACGSGRLTIPLAADGTEIIGLDISPQMLALAAKKAGERDLTVSFVQGDMRSFNLGTEFEFIFIPAQALSHLHERKEVEACFACVRQHLAGEGRFLIELFNPSMKLLSREPDRRYPIGRGAFEALNGGGKIGVTSQVRYDAATQVNHIRYFYRSEGDDEEKVLSFEMRQFFPQEIDALLEYNGFLIEEKYGSYQEDAFTGESLKQLIVCRDSK